MMIQLFDYSVDLLQAILWQYNEALRLQSLLQSKQAWYDLNQEDFWIGWYNDVFNLVTATDFGLAIWARILNIPLYININPEPDDAPIFGFNEVPSINTYVNFENGNFSNQGSSIFLTTEQQRLVLRLRYYQLISRGAIPEINSFLNALFSPTGGACWAIDNFDMTMTYVFNFPIDSTLLQVIEMLDVFPRPAGVGVTFEVLNDSVFGFGDNNQNFGNGNFFTL